jgi:hypothetical protein
LQDDATAKRVRPGLTMAGAQEAEAQCHREAIA